MDPQQRLLLELGYAALHGSAHRRQTLLGGDGGVFLGIERPDWALVQPPEARGSVYAVTGDNVSVAAGRTSFALGMQGPCFSIDTACAPLLSAHRTLSVRPSPACATTCVVTPSRAVALTVVPYKRTSGWS